jgi:hypothetical protein
MSRRFATLPRLLCLLALGCSWSTATPERAPTTAWNQQAVTELAGQLATATEAAYTGVYQNPEIGVPSMEDPADNMMGRLRTMHEMAISLHAHLEKGQGMERTLDQYRDIKELSRDVGVSGKYTDLSTTESGPLAGVSAVLNQLDAYYGPE